MKSPRIQFALILLAVLSFSACADDDGGDCPAPSNDAGVRTDASPVMPTPPTPRPTPMYTYVDVVIHNLSSRTLLGIYVSPAFSSKWGEDYLDGTVSPGAKFTLTRVPCGLNYDIKITAGSFESVTEDVYIECDAPVTELAVR